MDPQALRLLEHSPLTRGAAAETRRTLLDASEWRVVAPEAPLFRAGDAALAFIHAGAVRLYDAGSPPRVIGHRGPGEVVGEEALGEVEVAGQARAMTITRLLFIPAAVVDSLMESDRHLRRALIGHLVSRMRDADARLRLRSGTVGQRVAGFLLAAVARWGTPVEAGVWVDAPLTQQEIGDAIGYSRGMVSTALVELEREGVLAQSTGRAIVVVDLKALEELARAA